MSSKIHEFYRMQGFWNERYENEVAVYGQEPNAFLASTLTALKPSQPKHPHLLLPCDGEGRNAVWAAKNGWKTSSFDYSQRGVEKARKWARQAQVQVNAKVADAFVYTPEEKADVVGLIFAHMESNKRAEFHTRAVSWLRPGGHLVLEGFHPDQIHNDRHSGGPKKLDMMFTEEMLCSDFEIQGQMEILSLETVQTNLSEGRFHQGPADVIRMHARKRQ